MIDPTNPPIQPTIRVAYSLSLPLTHRVVDGPTLGGHILLWPVWLVGEGVQSFNLAQLACPCSDTVEDISSLPVVLKVEADKGEISTS